MKNNYPSIGISGVSRGGKDLFAKLLINALVLRGIGAVRYALADKLKNEIREPLLKLSGIDILSCTPEEKELVRDYLVAVGKIKRIQSHGSHWTSALQNQIEFDSKQRLSERIPIITDIRYDKYLHDEVYWITKQMGGILIHIERFDQDQRLIEPPNADERENDPRLKERASYRVQWPTLINEDDKLSRDFVEPFVEFYLKSYENI